eukprot:TRINITY_DN1340_c0_g1_i2.p1 TRINITY_DN1340_c0_g1~~TRINITY_DN1340_c0_g1_i2.p1  ORF type:complete len:176 (-),score=19.35 TRINITY_DN1340_c0_g1_i2:609-1136(-)
MATEKEVADVLDHNRELLRHAYERYCSVANAMNKSELVHFLKDVQLISETLSVFDVHHLYEQVCSSAEGMPFLSFLDVLPLIAQHKFAHIEDYSPAAKLYFMIQKKIVPNMTRETGEMRSPVHAAGSAAVALRDMLHPCEQYFKNVFKLYRVSEAERFRQKLPRDIMTWVCGAML